MALHLPEFRVLFATREQPTSEVSYCIAPIQKSRVYTTYAHGTSVTLILAALLGPAPHIDGVTLFVCFHVFGPNLHRLVGLARHEAAAGAVEGHGVNAGFRVQRARLHDGVHLLEPVARLVVPEVKAAVVATRHQNPVFVARERVDDGVVAAQVPQKLAVFGLPLLDVVSGAAHEGELLGVRRQ